MLALVFDTETTGLYNRKAPPSSPHQPDIVQLAAMLIDEERTYGMFNVYVHGDTEIPPEAYKAHRIDRDMTARSGVSRLRACQMLEAFAKKADVLVGHNIEFDIGVMKTAMIREGGKGLVLNKPQYCTMLSSVERCAIPHPNQEKFPGQFKWPTLTEAYCKLVDPRGFDNAHDALADVTASYEIYRVLRKKPE